MGRDPRAAFNALLMRVDPSMASMPGYDGSQFGPAVTIALRRKPSVLANALSGVLSSVLAEVILFPVDTVKLLTQTAAAGEAAGFFAVLLRMVRERGFQGLYGGLGSSVLKESVHSFNFWVWHGMLFRSLTKADDTASTPPSMRLLLNLLAKQLNWLCTVPFEVISSVNQLTPGSPGFIVTARALYKQGGIANFYRGLFISLVLAINPAIMNTLITTLLRFATMVKMACGMEYADARDHGPATVGAVTAFSKTLATLATYPLIRAKVLQQTSDRCKGMSPVAIWREILSQEGAGGLYRGVLAMSYKTVLWNALMMMVKNVVGPKRLLTPPASPGLRPLPMAAMGRDAFVDPMAAEKLDEILEYIRGGASQERVTRRVGALEHRLEHVSTEIQEIKGLLQHLVASSPTATSSR